MKFQTLTMVGGYRPCNESIVISYKQRCTIFHGQTKLQYKSPLPFISDKKIVIKCKISTWKHRRANRLKVSSIFGIPWIKKIERWSYETFDLHALWRFFYSSFIPNRISHETHDKRMLKEIKYSFNVGNKSDSNLVPWKFVFW